MSKEKQILHLRSQGYSQRRIAETLHVSRNTVAKVLNAAVRISLNVRPSMDDESLRLALLPEKAALPVQELPDYAYMHKELLKSGVTLKLLWEEYVNACGQSSKAPFMYSQFCKLYQDYVDQNHLTMHIRHKPGDKLMVDWAGTSLPLYNKVTGQSCKVYLFVATLPFSMYCYAEACRTMKEEDWIHAHINTRFLAALPECLSPTILRSALCNTGNMKILSLIVPIKNWLTIIKRHCCQLVS